MGGGLRIGDADRERAAAELAEHYAQGRLSTDEHAERLDRIWAARTGDDLRPVFADLPGSAPPAPAPGAGPRRGPDRRPMPGHFGGHCPSTRGAPGAFWLVLAVLLVVSVVTHLPIVIAGLVAWLVFSARRRSRRTSLRSAA